jgi:tyrosyl-tRNA synthetase
MSKSYDNYIAFNDSSKDIFGKTMSISDETMWDYYKLLLIRDAEEIEELKKNHPMETKKKLAEELTALFYSSRIAESERNSFSNVFTQRENPDEMNSYSISELLRSDESPSVLNILSNSNIFESKGQIRRLIQQGAIKIDGQKVIKSEDIITLEKADSAVVVKAGKKIFFRVVS